MREVGYVEGLYDEPFAAPVYLGLSLGVHAVAAGEQNLNVRADLAQKIEGFPTAHVRHDHVHDDQSDVVKVESARLKGISGDGTRELRGHIDKKIPDCATSLDT